MQKITGIKKAFDEALKNGFALGAFNFDNLDVLKAIVNASKQKDAYVMACVSEGALKSLGEDYLLGLMQTVRKQTEKVFFHLDHGKSFEICKKCVDFGFDSVMIDGSSLPFDENVALTKMVADYAHKYNVAVEGEIGVLAGIEEDISNDKSIYTNPDEAYNFVQKTGVDTLAVAIGTSHGAYKFKGEAKLDLDVLKQIQDKIQNVPLVLHGASSVYQQSVQKFNQYGGNLQGVKGVPDDILSNVCKNYNICKINTDTDLRIEFLASIRKYLSEHESEVNVRNVLNYASLQVQGIVEHKMHVLGI